MSSYILPGGLVPSPLGVAVFYNHNLTDFVGGGPTNIDGVSTLSLSYGTLESFVHPDFGYLVYQLQNSIGTTSTPQRVRPTDFNASTNTKVWILTTVLNDAAPAGTLIGDTLAANVVHSSLVDAVGGTFGTAAFTSASDYQSSTAPGTDENFLINSGGAFAAAPISFGMDNQGSPVQALQTLGASIDLNDGSGSGGGDLNTDGGSVKFDSTSGIRPDGLGGVGIIGSRLTLGPAVTIYLGGVTTIASDESGFVSFNNCPQLSLLGNLSAGTVNGNTVQIGTGVLALNNHTLSLSNNATISGTNTGDQTITLTGNVTGSGTGSFATTIASIPAISGANLTTLNASNLSSGTVPAGRMPALTGDITTSSGAVATTLATVNSNVGAFGGASSVPSFTVNGKGLITAASATAVIAPAGTLSGGTLNSGVTASSLTSTGTLTSGTTGAGFTVALGTSTITGVLLSPNGGNGSLPAFNAHLLANQTGVVSGTLTKFTANVMDWNVGTYFDTTGIKFVPPAGKYHFTVGVSWATPNVGPTFGYIYKNGTFSHRALFANAGGTIVGGCDEIANGTDYFECYFQQLSGVPLDIDSSLSGALSWWSAFRISN